MTVISDNAAEGILSDLNEGTRLKALSNEELVREYFTGSRDNDDLIVEEMCNRLWPEWANQQL